MRRVLKWVGLLVLALAVVVGVIAFRVWREREEHRRLREADLTRAPLSAPRSSRPSFITASTDASTDVCLVGVVLDGDAPVPDMQVSASEPFDVLVSQDTKACGCRWCDCPAGRAAVLEDPRLGCFEAVRSTTSRADGTFTLCGLSEPLPARLWGEHADGRVALAPKDLEAPRAGVPLRLQVLQRVAVDGVVLDDDGPVAQATVLFFHETPVRPFRATADSSGRFSMTLPRGEGRALVTSPSGASAFVTTAVSAEGVMVLRLETPFALDVHVTHDGRPVEGAEVSVNAAVERTSAEGDVHFEVSRGGSRTVRAKKGALVGSATVWPGRLRSRRLELPLVEGLTLRGVVVDEDGAPRAGSVRDGEAGTGPLSTDAAGRFVLEPRPPGEQVWLTAQAPGCADGSPERVTIAPRLAEVRLSVRCAASVRGQVLDADGSPVPGARITTKGAANDLDTQSTVTGHFSLQLEPGTVQLVVEHPRYRPLRQPVTAPSAQELVLVLDAGGSVAGRVVDAQGRGLAGVEVAALPGVVDELVAAMGSRALRGLTDGAGRFEVQGLGAGRWVVAAEVQGQAMVTSEAFALQPGERREGLELKAEGGVDVSGVVVDEKQAPVPGARVRFDPTDDKAVKVRVIGNFITGRVREALRLMPRTTVTSIDGRFEFRSVALSSVPLTVTAEGFDEATRVVTKGEQVRIELRRRARWTVTGRVTDDRGAPMPTFDINGSVFTPADGRFEVDGTDDSQVVNVRAPGFLSAQRDVKRQVPTADVGTIRLVRAQALTVRVRGKDGAPLGDARVRTKQGESYGDCETTDVGECVVTPLEDVETMVMVRHKAFTPKEATVPAGALRRPLEVTLEPALSRVEGQVVAAPGRPIVGQRVAVTGRMYETTTTNAEGRFSIQGLPQGPCCVSAKLKPGPFGLEWAVPAVASENPTPVLVGPHPAGGTVEVPAPLLVGRVVLVNGAAGPQTVKDFDTADADDLCFHWDKLAIVATITTATRFEGLPPGDWSVFVLTMEQLESRAGKVTPTVFELKPGETRVVE
ncbi:MAG: carboxypeptidase-like regulatory domain-containing protein [Myxococcaceae bacterium]|nr:carboxypeptidase-like regulatory domain-containing protein [Myxococcaceae bacterium]